MDRHCKNCDKMLYAGDEYCSKCGSRWVDFRLTPRSVVNEVSELYLGLDNKFILTMVNIVRFPEDVICGYIAGVRKRYMSPVNFYILSLTLVGLQVFILKRFGTDGNNDDLFQLSESQVKSIEAIMDYTGLFSTLNLPIYALAGYLVYKNLRTFNFTEHFIFSLYIWGFYNIITTIFTLPIVILPSEFGLLTLLPILFNIFHVFYAYKRIFRLSLGRSFLKAVFYSFIVSTLFFFLIIIAIIIVGLFLVNFFPEYLEAFKPQA